jgi:hypothetical protein
VFSGKLYYIDLNGAYLSMIDGIPHNLEPDSPRKYKINELIKRLYAFRLQAKRKKNPMEAMLKTMMVSCFGMSYQKPKNFKFQTRKPGDEMNKFIEDNAKFVATYDDEGNITTILPFKAHFNHPQFAKSILDNYHTFMEKISSIVNVLYSKIDSILVDENDFIKLEELGYIGSELGKFKVEHIFTEIAIISSCVWIGIREDGEIVRKCIRDKNESYESFKQKVLKKKQK